MSIKPDNIRNEPRPAVGEGNRLFESRPIDVRAYGHAGLRVLLDRTFRAVDGFGVAQFEAAGTSLREIADERDSAIHLLGRVVRYDGRRPARQRHRSAALRLLGHLHAAEQSELIVEIVRSSDEPVTVRAAAFDALGMLGDSAAVDLVARYADDEDERIAARALWALGRIGGHAQLTDLERRLAQEKSPARYDAILDAVAALGVRLGIPVAIPERGRKRPRPRRTSEVGADSAA